MGAAVARAIETLSAVPSRVLSDHPVEELRAFLEWLAEAISPCSAAATVYGTHSAPVPSRDRGLGIWRDAPAGFQDRPGHGPAESLGTERDTSPVVITKAGTRSTVHRPSYLDYIGVRRFGDDGQITGELGFLGLHVSEVYHGDPKAIPLLRHKIEAVMGRAAFAPGSHSARALQYILESYPRDELFPISLDELCETAMGILHLQERPRVRLFVRRDPYGRFLSCLVFVPRDRYNTDLRERMQAILREAVNAFEVDFNVSLAESPLARIHFMARTRPEDVAAFEIRDIEARLAEATRSWADRLHEALLGAHGEEAGNDLSRRYRAAFPGLSRGLHGAPCGARHPSDRGGAPQRHHRAAPGPGRRPRRRSPGVQALSPGRVGNLVANPTHAREHGGHGPRLPPLRDQDGGGIGLDPRLPPPA
jgi:glutamate dehydrogenase